VIEGNHLLSPQVVRELLPLSYPQSILRVEPQTLAKSLESQPPIAQATVKRQLLPPGLTIQVKERRPVAIAQEAAQENGKTGQETAANGLVDETGVFLPSSSYAQRPPNLELPTLKVIGSNEQYRPYWSEVYQAVSNSPVKIFEIDWQNPANLILKTELGNVHFGSYSSKFREQLAVLDRMRELPTRIQSSQILYIDLKNPEYPAIQVKKENEPAKYSPR
jgi:cell division protein FtsQ